MAIKPTTIVEWATANPQDPTSLQDAIIEPTAGKKASGFLRLEKPSRQDFNWVLNLIGLWIDYFEQTTDDNLANIATNTGDISTNAGNIVAATAAAGAAQDDIDDHIADTAGAHNDTAITNTSGVVGANVSLALDQVDTDINNHLSDTVGAHADTAISNSSSVVGTNVKLALDQLDSDVGVNTGLIGGNNTQIGTNAGNIATNQTNISANNTLITSHIADTAGAHNDTAIANTSSVAGANVQLALNALLAAIKTPLREDKAPGSINFPSTIAVNSSGESDTFTFTGAAVSDSVLVQLLNRNSLGVNDNAKWCVFDGIITAPNTMKILVGNPNGVSTVPPADLEDANFRITVFPA